MSDEFLIKRSNCVIVDERKRQKRFFQKHNKHNIKLGEDAGKLLYNYFGINNRNS